MARAAALQPDLPQVQRALADALDADGDRAGAAAAYLEHVRHAARDPLLLRAGAALAGDELPAAEALLRAHLKQAPTDVAAIRMLAELGARLGRYEEAQVLLERCLALAPGFAAARQHLALVLHRNNLPEAALAEVETLLAADPCNPAALNLKAVVLCRTGDYTAALDIYDRLLEPGAQPPHPRLWMSYGHALKTAGRQPQAIAAYRRSLALEPGCGEAWWSLANLKTVRFDDDDLAALRAQAGREGLALEDRYHLAFALGKALEDAGDYAGSFEHYRRGNALRRRELSYSAEDTSLRVQRIRRGYDRAFFAARAGLGCAAPDPIFIVGLPRAGSTLVEQILSSHSQVEGTMELPEILSITRELRRRAEAEGAASYHELLAALDGEQLRALGERYLQRTRIQRKAGTPLFIDKMPNNFMHVGLIQLILPNATIIDARRHPLGCCLSAFKQHFARGQGFTYSLEDLGRYYRDYVQLMAHFDQVLPGRVHRVFHEAMVEDTEAQVRALLDHCRLPFEDGCLRFFENDRPVRTASSEQVRRPINRDGVDHWRHYEQWLAPLKDALGPVLEAYPRVPDFPAVSPPP
ncbi:MAG: sulfotransferase [Pseudoxanthomonas sp.]